MALLGCERQAPTALDRTDVRIQRPNIVIVLADDQDGNDVGANGSSNVRTPNIDLLASEGMRFRRAFTATPMCSATRQQLYTGLYPVRSGAYPNHSVVADGTSSIATYFSKLGYRVGLNGKTHFGPAESFPFEFLDEKPFNRQWPALDFAETEAFIFKDNSQPFLLVVASMNPHFPWTMGDQSSYDPAKLTVPNHLVDTPETRQALANYYAEVGALDDEVGKIMHLVEQAGQTDNTVFIFTSEHGPMFMQGKWTLYDSGIKTAMIIRWPERIEAGSVTDAMVHYVDVVPTLLDIVGADAEDLDGSSFMKVLTGETNRHKDYIFGIQTTRGITNWREDYPIRSVRTEQYKLILNLNSTGVFGNNVTALNLGDYYESWKAKGNLGDAEAARKYRAYQVRPPVELYDVIADPSEQNNLAGQDEYVSSQARLTEQLQNWMQSQGDTGQGTESEAGKHMSHKVPAPNVQAVDL